MSTSTGRLGEAFRWGSGRPGPGSGRGVSATALAALALAIGAVPASGAAPPAAHPAFFRLSAISARPLAGGTATRYTVDLSAVDPTDAPTLRWFLRPAQAACSDAVVAGGAPAGSGELEWQDEGASFVWYHGPVGGYPADKAYGCDQAALAHGGSPGQVSVLAENEYEHCGASFDGATGSGAAGVCAVGGYSVSLSTLPVPASLLLLYRGLGGKLEALRARAQRGQIASPSALASALAPLQRAQRAAYASLFPPTFGCGFAPLFGEVSAAQAALSAQVTLLADGQRPSSGALAGDATSLDALARGVSACARTVLRVDGAPLRLVARLAALARTSARLARARGRSSAAVGSGLPALADSLDAILRSSFPTVFGMRYLDLVERSLDEQRSLGLAERAAARDDEPLVASALAAAAVPAQRTALALKTQSTRDKRDENHRS